VKPKLTRAWQSEIGGRVSSVTVAGGKVFVAGVDTHSVHALDETSGKTLWRYTAGGPVDSPPTIVVGRVSNPSLDGSEIHPTAMCLFGSADGRVYCLRASDGELAWRFRAARTDLRISAFGQIESPWPVHGSVLVENGVAYAAAGRSSFLDGGIHLAALEPATGKLLQTRTLSTVDPDTGEGKFDAALRYDMPPQRSGALSDILVSDGSHLYMRHTKFDPGDLGKDFENEMTQTLRKAFYAKQTGRVLDYGPQVVSTAGLLDGSWFNQTFWSFENASHCRLLVFDRQATYGIKAYGGGPSRHARSKFTVGSSKHLLFADDRQTKKRRWSLELPMRVRALVAAGETLFVAGAPDAAPENDPWSAYEGRRGGLMWAVSTQDGKKLVQYTLDAPPVWDGMAAANGRIFIATTSGKVEVWK